MSDPVTNVEIEDVLSSIRRLVSDGDKARTRDPAPSEHVVDDVEMAVEDAPMPPESAPVSSGTDRLVLTPAFLVVDSQPQGEHAPDQEPEPEAHAHHEDDAPTDTEDTSAQEEPFHLTDMVKDAVDEASDDDAQAEMDDDTAAVEPSYEDVQPDVIEAPDRSGLVATIADLEAAISAGEDDYEPDGSEEMSEEMSGVMAWPGTTQREADTVEDAEVSDETDDQAAPEEAKTEADTDEAIIDDLAETGDNEPEATFEHRGGQNSTQHMSDLSEDYGDDDLDGLQDIGGVALDDEALRALVGEIVREELTGPMGERITRNVRKLVRREIYRILSSQEFD